MKTILITDLNTEANFKLSKEGGGTLAFDSLVRILSRLSHKKTMFTVFHGVRYCKRLSK